MNLPDFSKRELRDASRLAVQCAVSAATLYILMKSLGMPEKFVGVLSAILVISPGIGSTITGAGKRVGATVIGAAIGVACLWLLPGGYGTAVALGISILVMQGIAGLFPQWQYGVVAAVALALGADKDLLEISMDRTLAIGLGVVVGTVSSLVIWPQKSSSRANAFIRDAIRSTARILETTLAVTGSTMSDEDSEKVASLNNRYSGMISSARSEAGHVRMADNDRLMERIDATNWLHQSLAIIQQIARNENNINSDDDEVSDMLEEIKKGVLEALKSITDKKQSPDGDGIRSIEEKIGHFREKVSHDNDLENWNHINRSTLVFALDQNLESLKKLKEKFSGPDED